MSSIKKIIFLLIGLISASLLGIVMLELIFGSWLTEDKWKEANSINIIRDRQLTYSVKHIYGEEMKTVSYSRDEFGLRGGCKDPKDITILTLGGSTTDQRLTSDGKTYQDVLQALLREEMGGDICISNAGVDGHSTFGHLASFDKWFPLIPQLKPKYFLLYIGINDAGFVSKPISVFDTYKRSTESSLLSTLREKSALYQLLKKSRDIFLSLNSHNAYAEHSSRPPFESEYTAQSLSADAFSQVEKNSKAFQQRLVGILGEISNRDATPICVSQPHLAVSNRNGKTLGLPNMFYFEEKSYNGLDYEFSINSLNATMKKLCIQADGFYIDIAAKSFERGDYYDVVHMNSNGTFRLGKYLFEEFKTKGIITDIKRSYDEPIKP